MHLRLFHKIFLLVALTALLAALAMAAVMSLNLRSGFDDYLDARDVESLEGVAAEYSQLLSAIASQRKLAPDDFEQLIAQNRPSDVRPPPPAERADVLPPSEPSAERRPPLGGRRPPLSFMPITGAPTFIALSSTLQIFSAWRFDRLPPNTVKSWLKT